MRKQKSNICFDPQKVYIGLDVHLRQWNVCIIQGGIKRKSFQQDPSAEVLHKHLKRFYPGMEYYSAYEAGFSGAATHYELLSFGINNIIFNAADVSQTDKERRRKTDAVDAAKIARSLANGQLDCIHIPPQWRLEDRNLIRLRSAQISDIKRKKIRLRHFLHNNGIRIPTEYANRWTMRFIEWIATTACEMNNATGEALEFMRQDLVRALNDHKNLNRKLLELMRTDRYRTDFELLRTVPGIGAVTAITLLLECGDLSDFSSAEAFCAFVGLVPDSDQSGPHDPDCSITKRRHKVLRYMMTECAWRAIVKDAHLSSLYAQYTKRMAAPKAIVKIANKLAKIIKFVLKNKKAYAAPT